MIKISENLQYSQNPQHDTTSHINITLYKGTQNPLQDLKIFFGKYQDLKHIVICFKAWEYFWDDDRMIYLAQLLRLNSMCGLISLEFDMVLFQYNSKITNRPFSNQVTISGFQDLFVSIGMMQSLQLLNLNLSGWGTKSLMITDRFFAHLGSVLGTSSNLIDLTLNFGNWGHSNINITDFGITALLQGFPSCLERLSLKLESLGFKNAELTNCSLFSIAKYVGQLSQLTKLLINMSEWGMDNQKSLRVISDEGVISLFESFIQLEKLTQLNIDMCGWGCHQTLLTDNCASQIIVSLKQMKKMKNLQLLNISLRGWVMDPKLKQKVQSKIPQKINNVHKMAFQMNAILQVAGSIFRKEKMQEIIAKLI